jgi:DNA modification methylase
MWCQIIIGDAREVLDQIPHSYVDLIVTSPPYFALKKYPEHPKAIDMSSLEGYLNDLREVFGKCFSVLKDGSFACVVVGQYTSKDSSFFIPGHLVKILEDVGFRYKREHIWVKPKGTQGIWNRGTTEFLKKPYPRNTMINIQHEHILIFQKGNDKRIYEKEKLTEQEIKEYSWSVWKIPVSEVKEHPAPFPEEIPKRLIKMYSYQSEIVLDPFLGSGTAAKVALDLNRNCIGIEVNPEYLPLIKRSIDLTQKRLLSSVDFKIVRYDMGQLIELPVRSEIVFT